MHARTREQVVTVTVVATRTPERSSPDFDLVV